MTHESSYIANVGLHHCGNCDRNYPSHPEITAMFLCWVIVSWMVGLAVTYGLLWSLRSTKAPNADKSRDHL
jgi:hypothetical protein